MFAILHALGMFVADQFKSPSRLVWGRSIGNLSVGNGPPCLLTKGLIATSATYYQLLQTGRGISMSVRKRVWKTRHGERKEAWLVDYRDQSGERHIQTFNKKREADGFHAT